MRAFFREGISRALFSEMSSDHTVVVFGQDVGKYGGSYQETRGLQQEFGAHRVLDTPVAEAGAIGVAVGAAANGLRPVVFVTYMDFLTLGLEVLVNYAAKIAFKTNGQLTAPLVVKTTTGAKGQGVAHSQVLASWLMNVPGLRVVAPSSVQTAYSLMRAAIRDEGPVVFMDHKRLFQTTGALDESLTPPLGRAVLVHEQVPPDLAIITYSYTTTLAVRAANKLAEEGVRVCVLDLSSLWPLDWAQILETSERARRVLLVEEGQLVCGVMAEIGFRILAELREVQVERLGPRRIPVSSEPSLENATLPSVDRIVEAASELLSGSHSSLDNG